VVEIYRFVADSSRSYANSVLLNVLWSLILLTLPIKSPLAGLFKTDLRVAMRLGKPAFHRKKIRLNDGTPKIRLRFLKNLPAMCHDPIA
jgi:hypothetical protein